MLCSFVYCLWAQKVLEHKFLHETQPASRMVFICVFKRAGMGKWGGSEDEIDFMDKYRSTFA